MQGWCSPTNVFVSTFHLGCVSHALDTKSLPTSSSCPFRTNLPKGQQFYCFTGSNLLLDKYAKGYSSHMYVCIYVCMIDYKSAANSTRRNGLISLRCTT